MAGQDSTSPVAAALRRFGPGLALAAFILVPALLWGGGKTLFREDFNDLAMWKSVHFPKVPTHTRYTIESGPEGSHLKAESRGSASALVYGNEFDVRDYPRIRWRWKVDNVYRTADPHKKAGDDYPLRVYVAFAYDPARAGLVDRVKYEIARKAYGEYPPHSSLSYVWSSGPTDQRVFVSPYTSKAMIVVLRQGREGTGEWQDQEVNVLDDYVKAFGERPPDRASLAVMNDSDNTGESAVSYIDYIEVLGPE